MEPIRLDFEWTEDDFVESQRLHLKGHGTNRLFVGALFAVVAGKLGWDIFSRQSPPPGLHDLLTVATVLTFITAVLMVKMKFLTTSQGGINRVVARKTFAKYGERGKSLAYTLSKAGLGITSPDGESQLKWSYFTSWLEGPTLFVLVAGGSSLLLPKRSLTAQTEPRVRRLLETKIGALGEKRVATTP